MNIYKINSPSPDMREQEKENSSKKINRVKVEVNEGESFGDILDVRRNSIEQNRLANEWRFKDMLEVNTHLNKVVENMQSISTDEILKPIASEDLLKLTNLLKLNN